MNSVSPLPIPLWPMLGLSLMLFGATTLAATFAAHQSEKNYANSDVNFPSIEAPVANDPNLVFRSHPRFFAQRHAN